MDDTLDSWLEQRDVVDVHTRALVSNLVHALGATSVEHHGEYEVGPEALDCLKDLRRWIKFDDQRMNRLDVKRVLAESNLVKGDLLEILSTWSYSAKFKADPRSKRICLKSVELLVPLTWPLEIEDGQMKRNHHRHVPYLKLAQVEYKRAILHHDVTKILRTVIELIVPYMLIPRAERIAHDEGMIRLALFLFRNLVMIDQPKDLPSDGNENEVSRSTTIEVFHAQGALQMVLAIASSIGEDYIVQDVLLLELLFHMLKGIDPEKLFMEEEQIVKKSVSAFKDLVQKEKSLLSGYKRFAPSRHGRFGTMVSLDDGQGQRRTVSGQEVLHSVDRAVHHMDAYKKWNRPRNRGKQDPDKNRDSMDFNRTVSLSALARRNLKRFVSDFLDSAFNPLFSHCRKAIEREEERVTTENSMHFFYLVGWFLKAECARRAHRQAQEAKKSKETAKGKESTDAALPVQEDFGFSLVASVLNQETFVLLNRYMESAKDNKEWKELNAGMTCFTQILLTVQQMSASEIEDDQEIAENIQNRIFYEESTHDRVVQLLRNYKDQGFGYLDGVTELAHTFIRMLETYSKQNADLQIRSRRRQRKKRKAAARENGETPTNDDTEDANDVAEVQIVSRERKFDFTRFVARFLTQQSVNTFVAFLKYYNDLSKDQVKRAHRFFYRVAFKNDLSVLLFRVDIIKLFHQMVEGPEGLDHEASYFSEWHDLAKQLFRRLFKKLEERPQLAVEMLFSKIPATLFYLEHGYDNVVEKVVRPPADLEVRPGMEWEQQIGVAVSVLINQSKFDALAWIKAQLDDARIERQSWEEAADAQLALNIEVARPGDDQQPENTDAMATATQAERPLPPSILAKPDNDERKTAMFKDNKLRLLMKLVGLERIGDVDDQDASWVVPPSLTADKLRETIDLISKFEFDPPTYEDGKSAESMLRSSTATMRAAERDARKAAFDDDSDDGIHFDDDLGEYGAGGPTSRTSDGADAPAKKRRLKKRKSVSDGEVTDEESRARKQAQAEKRRLKKLAEKQKFKSTVYVHDSDDEDDEEKDREFFAAEEERRRNAGRSIASALAKAAKVGARLDTTSKAKKRKSASPSSSGSESESESLSTSRKAKRPKRPAVNLDDEDDVVDINSDSASTDSESEGETPRDDKKDLTDTPISSQMHAGSESEDTALSKPLAEVDIAMKDIAADEEDDPLPIRSTARRRGGFVIESDDED